MIFSPTRSAALAALTGFIPAAGRRYADTRNFDYGPGDRGNVSTLSPYLRHRLVTEAEVVAAVRRVHSAAAAEKFLQEVLWRTYWKGWLELRPSVWSRYHADLDGLSRQTGGWRAAYDRALAGNTGIDCFDAWIAELAEHGYLHNHARMWFASIWIFTLRLPWQLGADLFYRQLYDGDPAANTLSWRWVAGLQTAGKTYLATADNIARYTGGRFAPRGLATTATALTEAVTPPLDLPPAAPIPAGRAGLLLSEDDCHGESHAFGAAQVVAVASAAVTDQRDAPVEAFAAQALDDARTRAAGHFDAPATMLPGLTAAAIRDWARDHDVSTVLTPYAPAGPARTALDAVAGELAADGIALVPVRRAWDSAAWPAARRGYFAFRESSAALVA